MVQRFNNGCCNTAMVLSTINFKSLYTLLRVTHFAQQQNGFLQFILQHTGFHQLQRSAIDTEISATTLAIGDCSRAFLQGN